MNTPAYAPKVPTDPRLKRQALDVLRQNPGQDWARRAAKTYIEMGMNKPAMLWEDRNGQS